MRPEAESEVSKKICLPRAVASVPSGAGGGAAKIAPDIVRRAKKITGWVPRRTFNFRVRVSARGMSLLSMILGASASLVVPPYGSRRASPPAHLTTP